MAGVTAEQAASELAQALSRATDRGGALLAAAIFVEQMSSLPTNRNGYTADGYKPASFDEKMEWVVRVADWLLKPTGKLVAPVAVAEPHLHRASCDDSGGNLVCGHPAGPTIANWTPPVPNWPAPHR